MPVHRFALREIMPRDPTSRYFAGTDRDRAAFEAGIKLGSILHQYVGVPLTRKNAASLERAIEAAARVQPLVEDVKVRIDRKRLRLRGPYRYGILTEDLLRVDVIVRVGRSRALGVLRYVPKLDYPLMYLKDIRQVPPPEEPSIQSIISARSLAALRGEPSGLRDGPGCRGPTGNRGQDPTGDHQPRDPPSLGAGPAGRGPRLDGRHGDRRHDRRRAR